VADDPEHRPLHLPRDDQRQCAPRGAAKFMYAGLGQAQVADQYLSGRIAMGFSCQKR